MFGVGPFFMMFMDSQSTHVVRGLGPARMQRLQGCK